MNKDFLNKLLSELNSDKNNSKNARVLIVDSMNTFLRSFSIIQHLNPNGHHVGGLVGYLKSVGYAIRLYQPTRVVLVFDGQGNSTNKQYLYPEYKANRSNTKVNNWKIFSDKSEESESMANQMGRLIEYLTQLPVSMIAIPKIEADDVIGYLVDKFESNPETDKITIMSADQDFLQLVSNKTEIEIITNGRLLKAHWNKLKKIWNMHYKISQKNINKLKVIHHKKVKLVKIYQKM